MLMILRFSFLALLALLPALSRADTPPPAAENPVGPPAPAHAHLPSVEDAIPGPVKALGVPSPLLLPGALNLAVTASDATAQKHVLDGLNHLHGGWEFEASRHFAAAMRIDPNCLLAHWGMVMSLLNPSPETATARLAATERLLDLVDSGAGTDLERGYAYGLIKYLNEGPQAAANAFRLVAGKFPNDLQSVIFTALFSRSGYDELGNPTPDQETAEKLLLGLVKKHPDNPVPLHALLSIRAEALNLKPFLDAARKLCQLAPDYAPYFHLLGHFEWRCGEHQRATAAFDRALQLFNVWMKDSNTGLPDCPGWVRAECYRITALDSKGSFDTALAAARKLAANDVPVDRAKSPGARALLWDAKTLPARLLVRNGRPGSTTEAIKSLPSPDAMRPYHEHCLAHWWIDGLRITLEAQRLLETKKLPEAAQAIEAITYHGERMALFQAEAAAAGERSAWTRAFRALEVLATEVRGRAALAGPKTGHGSAYNWFRSATDRQRPAAALNPPLILTPMAARLGDYYLAVNRPADAVEAFREALALFANDTNSLAGLERAAKAANLPDVAAEAAKAIQELQQN